MKKSMLSAILASTIALSGCTTYAPRYDSQGRYIGEQEVEDPGRTVATIGVLNGGLLGLALQAMGDHTSKEQQRQINEARMYGMQRQINQFSGNNQFRQQVYIPPQQNLFFACNNFMDFDEDGYLSPQEIVGKKDQFNIGESIHFVSIAPRLQGQAIIFELYDGNGILVDASSKTKKLSFSGNYYSTPIAPPQTAGSYIGVWYANGKVINTTPILVKS